MNTAIAARLEILHAIQGRIRVHVPAWSGAGKWTLETQLRQIQGVNQIQANALTGNILLTFDPAITNEQALLDAIGALDIDSINAQTEAPPELPPVRHRRHGDKIRARIAVRGLDHDPHLAHHVVEQLEKHPGVHASADQLTGRVLIEFTEHEAELDDLLALVANLELPELPDEDWPAYPLDPGPLLQSTTRTIGATLGLCILATRRLLSAETPLPGASTAITVASVLSILQGTPLRAGLRHMLGRPLADLLFSIPSIITLTMAESAYGLAVSESEALRALTEVRARRSSWLRYEDRIENAPSAQPGATIRLESGERTPLAALVLEGRGMAIGLDGLPMPIIQGHHIPPGARIYGGSFLLQLAGEHSFQSFTSSTRSTPLKPTFYDRYLRGTAIGSLLYAGVTALITRSFRRALIAMILVNARPAVIGQDNADLGAFARVIRAGTTVVGTRQGRMLRLPNLLLIDGARLLSDRLELVSIHPLQPEQTVEDVQTYAANVASAVGSPWGGTFGKVRTLSAHDGVFDGSQATAVVDGLRYSLGPIEHGNTIAEAAPLIQQGNYVLVLRNEQQQQPLGLIALRPRLAHGVEKLVQTCARHSVQLALLPHGNQMVVHALAQRAHITLVEGENALHMIHAIQQDGKVVAFVADNINASSAFAACDLAIGLTDGRSRFPARADVLAPDLRAVCAIIDAAARRKAAIRDSLILALASNAIGAVLGLVGEPGILSATRVVNISSLLAIGDSWLRLRGGEHALSPHTFLEDPHPERWGRRSIEEIQRIFQTTDQGLTNAQAATRHRKATPYTRENQVLKTLRDQFHSPLIGLLAAGAGLSLSVGAVGDVALIAGTIVLSVGMSVWQDQKANQVTRTLQRMDIPSARVLRNNNQTLTISATEVVPGDILLLAPGDRVTADARVIDAQNLEVDEAALTGESLPVQKVPAGKHAINRIVLEGTDVTTGTGRAIVVAVGRQTQMGATRAVLTLNGSEASPLGTRLSHMLRLLVPLSLAGGVVVIGTGLFWGQPIASLLALGVTVSLAAVPEGLPLLAKVGEAGVAYRLAGQQAVVRRLSAIEALGRVDVACADKTGTMTMGQLRLSLVASMDQEAQPQAELSPPLRNILRAAALASPEPGAQGTASHPTDMAVIQGALAAGLGEQIAVPHEAELPFDPSRSFHVSRVQGHLYIKGAPETILARCNQVQHDKQHHLTEITRHKITRHALRLTRQGLRILMIAEGPADADLNDPQGLTMLGFIGISDPLRDTVRTAVNRCRDAGIHVIMITGDHPATASAIAEEAGLLVGGGQVYTASELAELPDDELDRSIERTVVIARATPLDKLRIIESLQRQGHTVAMTGDGVNDAPALRLANVGVAMGGGSTEVARQTADVVIANDDFSTLVETFVEGRSFWRNIRRALGLLLGGNLGELGLIIGASLLGNAMPLNARQILALNAITDILPALAVALQQPEHRNLAELSREGTTALGVPLRNEIFRRSIATALPSLAAYMLTLKAEGSSQACSIAYASIITTQLAQTLDAGRAEGHITSAVLEAVAASLGIVIATFAVPPLRSFLDLTIPSTRGLALIGGSTLAAVLLNYLLAQSQADLQHPTAKFHNLPRLSS